MIKDAIAKVVDRLDLTEAEAEAAMQEVIEGQATPAQIAAYVTALRMKGETVDEITGSARAMRAKAVRVRTTDPVVVDKIGRAHVSQSNLVCRLLLEKKKTRLNTHRVKHDPC